MLKHLTVLNTRHRDTGMFTSDAWIVYLQKVNKDGNTSKSIIINVVIDIPTHIPTPITDANFRFQRKTQKPHGKLLTHSSNQ